MQFGSNKYIESEEYALLRNNDTDAFFAKVNETQIMDYIPEELQQILILCLQPDPALRPSISEVSQHEWSTGDYTNYAELQDYMDVVSFTAREDSFKGTRITEEFISFIDRRNKRQPIISRQYSNQKHAKACIKKGYQCFVTDKPEQLFNALCAYNQQNGKKSKILAYFYGMSVMVSHQEDFVIDISIYNHTACSYLVEFKLQEQLGSGTYKSIYARY